MNSPISLLVVGGAGYIGSHMVRHLLDAGCAVAVFDNLSTGYRDAVPEQSLVVGDLADKAALGRLFSERRFDGVLHFASFIQAGESVIEPAKYYANNLTNTLNLFDAMRDAGVKHLIFSSSAAVYGEPDYLPIDEAHPKAPVNPYGKTKWMVEQILADYDRAYGLKSIALRYFNAAGADPQAQLGERHIPETHLIPLVLQVAAGRRPHVTLFGRDYDTPDGTCIRDYVHVTDLCVAHWLALKRLFDGGGSTAYNLGNGSGFSVLQVIEIARQITGRIIDVVEVARREGDPARLIASSARAVQELGWAPKYCSLETIIGHAWAWEQKLPLARVAAAPSVGRR